MGEHHSIVNDIGPANQLKGLTHVVVGDQDADATLS